VTQRITHVTYTAYSFKFNPHVLILVRCNRPTFR